MTKLFFCVALFSGLFAYDKDTNKDEEKATSLSVEIPLPAVVSTEDNTRSICEFGVTSENSPEENRKNLQKAIDWNTFNRNWQIAQGSIIANTGETIENIHSVIIEGEGHTSLSNIEAFSGSNPDDGSK
ncbi:hypothetical protein EZS27_009753 [termite gut metagenome]|uniref:Uncharacterized protein n=1 Tax=termite gut metagenome TaxID=433724 RepID=A0A5J4SB11_9ZZZZ